MSDPTWEVITIRTLSGILMLALLLSGCSVTGPEAPVTPRPGEIFETSTGNPVSFEELREALMGVSVIFVGETHDQASHHEVQLRILRSILEYQGNLVIGMEMFGYEQQEVLDAWIRGEMSEDAFLRRVGWEENWGHPYILYRDILEEARNWSLPVLGLNAPGEVVGKTARFGLSGLTPSERSRIAKDIFLDLPEYRKIIRRQFETHEQTELSNFEFFFQAQRVWDETMAETLAAHVPEFESNTKILVFTGSGHLYKRQGVVEAFERRTGLPLLTVIPVSPERAREALALKLGDYIWVAAPSKFTPPRLGVTVDNAALSEGRLEVSSVLEGTIAAKMGLQPGDVLESLNDVELHSVHSVHKAIMDAGRGRSVHQLRIRRNGVSMGLTFSMDPNPNL